MDTSRLRPDIEATKQALRRKEAARRERAWRQLLQKGTDPGQKAFFERTFSQAYWTGAMDVVQHDVRARELAEKDNCVVQ